MSFCLTPLLLAVALAADAPSDHFDGTRFHNTPPTRQKTLLDAVKWNLTRQPNPDWQQLPAVAIPKLQAKVEGPVADVTFINHATTLVQLAGRNILTDPVYSERVSPVSFMGPKRYHPPAIPFESLPNIDLVVISHNHYDHLDLATLKRLEERFKPRILVGKGSGEWLRSHGLSEVVELDWWEKFDAGNGLEIIGVPAQHWSIRSGFDRNRMLWLGYAMSYQSKYIYFAGDTGYGPHFKAIHERLGAPSFSLLPIGAYLPRYMMIDNHMSPDDAVKAHIDLKSPASMGIHYGTFALADEGQRQPITDLAQARSQRSISEAQFWAGELGIVKRITLNPVNNQPDPDQAVKTTPQPENQTPAL